MKLSLTHSILMLWKADVEIFIHIKLESHALDLVLFIWEWTRRTKKKNETERRRRRRKKEKKKRKKKKRLTAKPYPLHEVTCKTKPTHSKTKSTPLLPSLPAKPNPPAKKNFFFFSMFCRSDVWYLLQSLNRVH